MINLTKIILICVLTSIVSNCSKVLQPVELQLNAKDASTQEEFNVIEKTLTIREAKKQNKSPFNRVILQSGIGSKAKTITESLVKKSKFPNDNHIDDYKIGIGDTLTLSRLIENNHSQSDGDVKWPSNLGSFNYKLGVGDNLALTLLKEEKTLKFAPSDENDDQRIATENRTDVVLESKGRIGSDGSVLLLEIGRLDAKGKTLSDLQSEVRNILIRNGASPRFQLEIIEFKSQKVYLTINENSTIQVLDDQKITLLDILTSSQVGLKPGITTQVRLLRRGKKYLMPLHSIFDEDAPDIIVYDKDHIFVEDRSTNIISSVSKVGHNGEVVFTGIGSVKAVNRTLSDLRAQISSQIDEIPGSENAFQIEITEFSSQTALVNIPNKVGGIIPITDIPRSLDEILIDNGLGVSGNNITRINLLRQGENYVFTLDDLLKLDTQRIYLKPNDLVTTETLEYKESKVFVLGGVKPQIFKINPSNRETLADVLFTEGGVLDSTGAKRSDVFLLRGTNPVIAYHLNAQNPTRLIVAEAMELRPNDILYVAEQPIISFNRTLATIVPLRLLIRDIQDENIP